MTTPLPINPVLNNLPVYQPGRPIEEVARELGLDPAASSSSRRTKPRSARRAWGSAAMRHALKPGEPLPDATRFT